MALNLYYLLLRRFGLYALLYGQGTRAELRASELLWVFALLAELRFVRRIVR